MNPFDDPDGRFLVLRNDRGEYSLWPDFAEVPRGWLVRGRDLSRDDALALVEDEWTDPPGSVAVGGDGSDE
ncbi:MbtH family protein [Corynebacterium sp. TAE3-ERU12]|uniref:MbtH family protein n=1 Tax=Corynebacterium sp. TAE3-ERU12 TaxID=2849491 RepID=UPI001C4882BE|nr:MbtH family protein [Corynebacterium sp. TAE3-ERU12]MBV7294668.1 MbtH family protein [Corynebacterium sp. TAE3-ERU12]